MSSPDLSYLRQAINLALQDFGDLSDLGPSVTLWSKDAQLAFVATTLEKMSEDEAMDFTVDCLQGVSVSPIHGAARLDDLDRNLIQGIVLDNSDLIESAVSAAKRAA